MLGTAISTLAFIDARNTVPTSAESQSLADNCFVSRAVKAVLEDSRHGVNSHQ
jgi:hypothetical protein